MRFAALLTGALLAGTGTAWAQAPASSPSSSAAPTAPASLTPQQRAEADAAAIRARAAAALQARTEAENATRSGGFAPVANAQLVYGDYICTLSAFDAASRRLNFTPKGTIQFNANGTYRYSEGGALLGRYTYDASTKQVIWITGYFAEHAPSKTVFSIGDKAAKLDIDFAAPAGGATQTWNCGCNKK